MVIIAIGQHAHGIIAIGQVATGVIAIGQSATGVIAIGQVARGGLAIGQLAIGVWSIGMASFGLMWAAGIVGVGGKAGFGFILSALPNFGRKRILPETTTLDALYKTRRWAGWIEIEVRPAEADGYDFFYQGQPLRMGTEGIKKKSISKYAAKKPFRTFAFVNVAGSNLTCTRLMDSGQRVWTKAAYWIGSVVQLALLVGIAVALWYLAFVPIGETLFGAQGVLLPTK